MDESERWSRLQSLEDRLEGPLALLGLAWLVLLIVEFTSTLSPFLEAVGTAIWIVFVADFLLKFVLAPRKLPFLKSNVLTLISLLIPALRIVRFARFLRAARAVRGLRLVRLLASVNRGMKSVSIHLGRWKFGYVLGLSTIVCLAGAAGMYLFESEVPGGFRSYAEATWWTAMLLTSVGSEYWPQTGEGRVLCFLISLYGLAMLGYITAWLATFFLGEAVSSERALRQEVDALRKKLAALEPPGLHHVNPLGK